MPPATRQAVSTSRVVGSSAAASTSATCSAPTVWPSASRGKMATERVPLFDAPPAQAAERLERELLAQRLHAVPHEGATGGGERLRGVDSALDHAAAEALAGFDHGLVAQEPVVGAVVRVHRRPQRVAGLALAQQAQERRPAAGRLGRPGAPGSRPPRRRRSSAPVLRRRRRDLRWHPSEDCTEAGLGAANLRLTAPAAPWYFSCHSMRVALGVPVAVRSVQEFVANSKRESGENPERSRRCERGADPHVCHCPSSAGRLRSDGKEDGKARASDDP